MSVQADAERRRHTQNHAERRRQAWILSLLLLAAFLAATSAAAGILAARTTTAASQADVERNRRLVEQVKQLEEAGNQDVHEHRIRNEQLHACIVDLALMLADPKRDRTKPIDNPCPTQLESPGR